MTGLWLEGERLRVRADLPLPRPPAGEVLVRVLRAGICGTDLEMLRGYVPFTGVPGHEFVGVAVDGTGRLDGRRVVGEINAACGCCPACRAGRRNHCPKRTVLGIVGRHGAFAEYLTLPRGNLHPVPDGLSTDEALFTEPLAAALRIREQVALEPGQQVLVVGAGKLGQLVARVVAASGARLHVIARHESQRRLLAGSGIPCGPPGSAAAGSCDVAVECTGNEEGFEEARRAVRPCGTLVLKSTYAGGVTLPSASLVVDEIRLVGSRCGPFAPALEMLAAGRIDVQPLLEARYPLHGGPQAFEHAARPGACKVVLDVGPGPVAPPAGARRGKPR